MIKKKNIEDLVPKENIETYTYLYHLIKERQNEIKKAHNSYHVTEKIRSLLTELVRTKWLTEDYSKEIIEHVYNRLARHDNLKRIPVDLGRLMLLSRGAPTDWALDALVSFLIEDAKIYSNRPGYGAVAAFLNHQGITLARTTEIAEFSDINIRKRYKRMESDYIYTILLIFDFIYAAEQCPPAHQALIPRKLSNNYDPEGSLKRDKFAFLW